MTHENVSNDPATWYVFETFVADGSLAIGVAQGEPDPAAGMVVGEGLTRAAAHEVAARLARDHRDRGLPLPPVAHDGVPPDAGLV